MALLVVSALALVAASCGVEVGRSSLTAGTTPSGSDSRSNGGDVVGGETATTTTQVTTTTAPPPPDVEIQGDDGSPTNITVANAIADLQDWWGREYPRIYFEPYEPMSGGFYAIDRTSDVSDLPCAPSDDTQVLGNAYYCPPSDAVVWDQEQLMPELASSFGDFAPAVVIAHEWGHAIQARSNFNQPTVIFELQADCFAGAWVRHVRYDAGARFSITTDDLDQALAGFLSLRDAPGSTADDPNAHGSGFDRVRSFQEGFEDGLRRCAEYRNGDPRPFQFPFSGDPSEIDSGGDLPLHTASGDGILDLIPGSLDTYWTNAFPDISGGSAWGPLGPPVSFDPDKPPDCDGDPVESFELFVCIPDRYVGYVEDPTLDEVYDQGGDFAVATLIATKYGVDAQAQLGDLPDDATTALRGDCYAGSWAASILPDRATDQGDQTVTLSPGDLDEAVGVLLSSRTQDERDSKGPGFDRVRAFRVGVVDGATGCADVEAG